MRDLHYSDITTAKHTVSVVTWTDLGQWHVRFVIDGKPGAPEVLGPVAAK